MFGYLEGKLVNLTPTHTYLDVGGVGYEVQLTLHTYEAISGKASCRLYTHLQIREDAWVLYGFATETERSAFQRLLSISGVGAATARILLSSLTAADLSAIVLSGNVKALEKVKGIGAKTAQRIILELKGKLPEAITGEFNILPHNTKENDALNALLGLGIGKAIAETAVRKAKTLAGNEDISVEEWIKSALKNL
ncbi:Holliday junction branch migration protein RuvA [Taibaiella koreensis]|uniref:Holliday junction branch migration protein RuvA n=1 Tax=Taibaiella koreensis TaxID=1268548 RepID=UPI000E59C92A|nr:Holliday junction branch migration protein RuvA [Taibaiella koreensis]